LEFPIHKDNSVRVTRIPPKAEKSNSRTNHDLAKAQRADLNVH
jgi:hypothetical protein